MAARAGHEKVCALLTRRGAELDVANAQSGPRWWSPPRRGTLPPAAPCSPPAPARASCRGRTELPPLLQELRPGLREESLRAASRGQPPPWRISRSTCAGPVRRRPTRTDSVDRGLVAE
ncbi:unnamed protein product [Prorocentrum cordatum]|uniref:Uncharacterized protein n=1 Tax=Prorocentrum cordatum TaxID=2364126 RepID=A0ABN9QNQ9_9DINO|nr:unnamed protein product [Polarella glacialis]